MKGLLFLTFIVASVFAQDHLLLPGETLCSTHYKCPPPPTAVEERWQNFDTETDCVFVNCTKQRLVNGPFALGLLIGYAHGFAVYKDLRAHWYFGCVATAVHQLSLSKDGTLQIKGDDHVFTWAHNATFVELTHDGEVVLGGVEGGKVEGCLYKGN